MSKLLRGVVLYAAMTAAAPAVAVTYVPPQTSTRELVGDWYHEYGGSNYLGVMDPAGNRLAVSGLLASCGPINCQLGSDFSGIYLIDGLRPRTVSGTNYKGSDARELVLKTGFERRVYGNLVAYAGTIDEFVTIRFGLANEVPTSMGYSLLYQTVSGSSTLASGVLTADNPNFAFAQAFDMQDGDSIGMVFDYRGSNRNEAVYVYAGLKYTTPGYTIPDPPPPPPPPPTVPEPAVWAQLLLGFFTSGALLRRRRGQPV